MKIKCILISSLICLLLLGATAFADEYRQQVLIYMLGSDLGDTSASKDLDEMREALSEVSDEDVCILLLTGGAEKWADEDLANGTVYRLTADGLAKVDALREAADMASAGTLEEFLRFSRENYPASRRGLIFWNHGFGPMEGFGLTVNGEGDKLTLGEISAALDSGNEHFDWIGFDACLMGSIETAAALAPYADYLIASEETEPWEGWNYAFLGQLSADQGGEEIGSMIVEDYRTFYTEKYEEYPYLTPILSLTCIDLKQIGCVEEAMDALFTAISADIQTEHYAEIVTARNASRGIGLFTTGSSYDLVDLKSCVEGLSRRYPLEAEKLSEALDDWQVSGMSNADQLNGLSVYFPFDNIPLFLGRWGFIGESIGCSAGYRSFLHDYSLVWMAHRLEEWQPAATTLQDGEYAMQLTDEQINNLASYRYIVLECDPMRDDAYRPVYFGYDMTLRDNELIAGFDGDTMFATLADRSIPVLAEKTGEDKDYVYFHLLVTLNTQLDLYDENSELKSAIIQVKYDKANDRCLYTGTIPGGTEELETGKSSLRLEDYGSIIFHIEGVPYLPLMDREGNYLPFNHWKRDAGTIFRKQIPIMQDGQLLQFEYKKFNSRDRATKYVLLLEATDVYGTCIVSRLIPIAMPYTNLREATVRFDGQSIALVDDEILSLELDSIHWTDTFSMELGCANNSDRDIQTRLESITINRQGSTDTFDNLSKKRLTPGKRETIRIENNKQDLRMLTGKEPIEQIDFLLSAESDAGTVYYLVHIDCLISPETERAELLPLFSLWTLPDSPLYSDGFITVELDNVTEEYDLSLVLHVKNHTERVMLVNIADGAMHINGWLVKVDPDELLLLAQSETTVNAKIKYADLWKIEADGGFDLYCRLKLSDYITKEKIDDTRSFSVHLERKELPVVLDSEGVKVRMQLQNSDLYLNDYQLGLLRIIAENDTYSQIEIEMPEMHINGKNFYPYEPIKLSPKAKIIKETGFYTLQWGLHELNEPLENLTVKLRVWNEDTKVEIGTYEIVLYPTE